MTWTAVRRPASPRRRARQTRHQNAQNATKAASDAEMAANDAVHRADSLDSVVKGLDQYKQVADVSVTFGFDKSVLTKDDKEQLDSFAASLGSAKSYILEVTGGTDSTGPAQYNYDLSQRRADAVVQYLAAKYGIAAAPLLSDRHRQRSGSGARTIPVKAASRTAASKFSCFQHERSAHANRYGAGFGKVTNLSVVLTRTHFICGSRRAGSPCGPALLS